MWSFASGILRVFFSLSIFFRGLTLMILTLREKNSFPCVPLERRGWWALEYHSFLAPSGDKKGSTSVSPNSSWKQEQQSSQLSGKKPGCLDNLERTDDRRTLLFFFFFFFFYKALGSRRIYIFFPPYKITFSADTAGFITTGRAKESDTIYIYMNNKM